MGEEVLALCRAMGAADDQEGLLKPLIAAAEARLTAQLRPGLTPQDCGAAFPLAVAMTAMEGLDGAADGVSSFTAGEVTIRTGKRTGLAQRGRDLLAPWLGETGFAFQGVTG